VKFLHFFCYDSILSIRLKDPETFVIEYEGASHVYEYASPVAVQIIQEVRSRLQLRQMNKHHIEVLDFAKTYQDELMKRRTKRVSSTPIPILNNNTNNTNNEKDNPNTNKSPNDNGFTSKISRSLKLNSIFGDSPEQRVEAVVTRNLSDPNTVEGGSFQNFITKKFSSFESDEENLLSNCRIYLNNVHEYIIDNQHEDLQKLLIEKDDKLLSDIVEATIEKIFLDTFRAKIDRIITRLFEENDKLLNQKISLLRENDQNFFSIPERFISQSNWKVAILELEQIKERIYPMDMLECILNCAQTIYLTSSVEHEAPLNSMDDFLPVLIFVTSKIRVPNLYSITEFIFKLVHPDSLAGESGFYLTVFQSAVLYLYNYEQKLV